MERKPHCIIRSLLAEYYAWSGHIGEETKWGGIQNAIHEKGTRKMAREVGIEIGTDFWKVQGSTGSDSPIEETILSSDIPVMSGTLVSTSTVPVLTAKSGDAPGLMSRTNASSSPPQGKKALGEL